MQRTQNHCKGSREKYKHECHSDSGGHGAEKAPRRRYTKRGKQETGPDCAQGSQQYLAEQRQARFFHGYRGRQSGDGANQGESQQASR
ncbi:MAG: hypothetical protein V2J89_11305 [Halieaceae bacterium]|nr:hypothetical protein [Halieaceae bacterium]